MSNFDLNDDNPFRAPSTVEVARQNNIEGDAVAIRRHHLSHEASIQGVGSLYILGGVIVVFAGLSFAANLTNFPGGGRLHGTEIALSLVMCASLFGIGFLYFVTGLGMKKVRPWTKIPGTLLAVIGLVVIPVGTLLSIYTFYLLYSSKGNVVLAESYQGIIAVTPEIKYKTPTYVKALAIALIAMLVLLIGAVTGGF